VPEGNVFAQATDYQHNAITATAQGLDKEDFIRMTSDFVTAVNGTFMLVGRDVKKRGTLFRNTRGLFVEEPGMTEFKDGVSHAPTVGGTHQVLSQRQDQNRIPAYGYRPE
jgi:hypothetical protein